MAGARAGEGSGLREVRSNRRVHRRAARRPGCALGAATWRFLAKHRSTLTSTHPRANGGLAVASTCWQLASGLADCNRCGPGNWCRDLRSRRVAGAGICGRFRPLRRSPRRPWRGNSAADVGALLVECLGHDRWADDHLSNPSAPADVIAGCAPGHRARRDGAVGGRACHCSQRNAPARRNALQRVHSERDSGDLPWPFTIPHRRPRAHGGELHALPSRGGAAHGNGGDDV